MLQSNTKLRGREGALRGYALFYIFILYAPILLLQVFSFNDSALVTFPLKGFTFKWYEQMLANPQLIESLFNSLKVGVASAICSTVFGTLAALALSRHNIRGGTGFGALIALPLVVPEIVLGISLLVLATSGGVPLSLFTVTAGHILFCMPIAMLIMTSRLSNSAPSLEEASQDLGETLLMTYWRVTLPIAIPGLIASLLLTFTISFDEFVLAFFLSGTEPTLPVFIWSQLRFPSKFPGVLALGSCIFFATIVLIVIVGQLRQHDEN